MRKSLAFALSFGLAGPAWAAESEPFFSLRSTEFIVTLAFLLFLAVLVYLKVPSLLGKMLDKRAEGIKSELDEARALREEAQTVLASFERKQAEVKEHAEQIIVAAREDATIAAEQAREALQESIARRLAAAEDQIASARAAAVKEVRDTAISVATRAAGDVIASQMTAARGNKLIDAAIADVDAKLH